MTSSIIIVLLSLRNPLLVNRLENKRKFIDSTTGNEIKTAYKVAPVSSPAFQEFRIWKTISNLKIVALTKLVNGELRTDQDETDILISPKQENLFEFFDRKEKISLNDLYKEIGVSSKTHRLNYPEDTVFPGNKTKFTFLKIFRSLDYPQGNTWLQDADKLYQLWHLLYSVDDTKTIKKNLLNKFKLPQIVAEAISKIPAFELKYASYPSRAINRLLPIMRCGKYWDETKIDVQSLDRIHKIIDGEYDPNITNQVRIQLQSYTHIKQFCGMPEYLATYTVYGVHSENIVGIPVEEPHDVKIDIKAASLRNPIVEQRLNETMQLVKDIWKQYGRPDNIRIEMAREFKKNASERKTIYDENNKNKEDRERIKAIRRELKIGNPNSLGDIEKLRIAEENAKYNGIDNDKKPFFRKSTEPTSSEIEKYRLWMDQKCISPYTGEIITLSKLYTLAFEVDHIIPRSRYYDDSLQNKVVVECWANKDKGNMTAMQYIRKGTLLPGKKILSVENYLANIEKYFSGNKRRNLLADEIPQGFIARQLNDTRHISRKVKELLYQVTPNVYTSVFAI
jgi:CRISPR-associated endonuclease Csn1